MIGVADLVVFRGIVGSIFRRVRGRTLAVRVRGSGILAGVGSVRFVGRRVIRPIDVLVLRGLRLLLRLPGGSLRLGGLRFGRLIGLVGGSLVRRFIGAVRILGGLRAGRTRFFGFRRRGRLARAGAGQQVDKQAAGAVLARGHVRRGEQLRREVRGRAGACGGRARRKVRSEDLGH
jgi:hypothetical protein